MPSEDLDSQIQAHLDEKRKADLNAINQLQRKRKIDLKAKATIKNKVKLESTLKFNQISAAQMRRGDQPAGRNNESHNQGQQAENEPEEEEEDQEDEDQGNDQDDSNENEEEGQDDSEQTEENDHLDEEKRLAKREFEDAEKEGAEDTAEAGAEGAAEAGSGELAAEAGAAEVGADAALGAGAAEAGGAAAAAGGAEAGAAGAGILATTWEFWVPALLIILGIGALIGLVIFIFVSITAACNSKTFAVVKFIDEINPFGGSIALVDSAVCKQLTLNSTIFNGGASGGAGATGGILAVIPQPYVKMSAFGTAKFDYPKVQSSFLPTIETIMDQANAANLGVHVTSALRQPGGPEGFSCHYLGEAVDIDFDNPIPIGPNPSPADAARLDALLNIVKNAGPGFYQDEYRHPSGGATAGHVHIGLTASPNCTGRDGEVAQYANEYTMPY